MAKAIAIRFLTEDITLGAGALPELVLTLKEPIVLNALAFIPVVGLVDDDWTEDDLTYNTAPAVSFEPPNPPLILANEEFAPGPHEEGEEFIFRSSGIEDNVFRDYIQTAIDGSGMFTIGIGQNYPLMGDGVNGNTAPPEFNVDLEFYSKEFGDESLQPRIEINYPV